MDWEAALFSKKKKKKKKEKNHGGSVQLSHNVRLEMDFKSYNAGNTLGSGRPISGKVVVDSRVWRHTKVGNTANSHVR
jgi:hypothetical protein